MMADEVTVSQAEPEEGVTVEVAPYNEKPGKPQLTDEEVEKLDELPPEDEIGRYAKDAQRRIKSLHVASQEWRRRAVQSQRELATATNLAQQIYRENQDLKAGRERNEQALIDQALGRAEAQLAQAESHFIAARQAGDVPAEARAQVEIARFVAEADRLRLLRPAGPPVNGSAPAAAAGPPPQQQPPPPPPMSEDHKAWLGRNAWYQKPGEEERTQYALGVDQSLAAQGIFEATNPKEYWGTIDRKLREKFPEKFDSAQPNGAAQNGNRPVAVAAATRTNGTEPRQPRGPRHVVLSESQVKLARSLGLTNEQYAMQLVKDEKLPEGSYHDIATRK